MVRCLYEVLDVEKDADDGVIRLAYRKAALRYDSHRDAILRSGERHQAGGGASPGDMVRPEDMDLFGFFTSTAYTGYGDGPSGFYAVYSRVFANLAKAEAASSKQAGSHAAFGTSSSPWSEVNAFYNHWAGFVSKRDFSWADEYDVRQAPNRKVRRMIESENEKARKAARREFNEQVRELVAFVKKRDKRVLAHAAEEAARRTEAAAKAEERRLKEQAERQARAQEYKEATWVTEQGDVSGSGSEEDDPFLDYEVQPFTCLVCDKFFKSQAALDNHARLKGHSNEEFIRLMAAMSMEETEDAAEKQEGSAELEDGQSATSSSEAEETHTSSESAPESSGPESDDDEEEPPKQGRDPQTASPPRTEGTGSGESSGEGSASEAGSAESEEEDTESEEESGSEDDAAYFARRLAAMKAGARTRQEESEPESSDEEPSTSSSSEEEGLTEEVMESIQQKPARRAARRAPEASRRAVPSPVPSQREQSPAPKLTAKQKRQARAAKAKGPQAPVCQVCGEGFQSRTQLFKHIATSGHAAPK
ncbi:hypothetical protein QBZ16_003968 [Prototheca wickerhamii]|uniref:C2H2-type domain-containing protein n=1 Tax=Prototheca wickerhamii TaxID=3111 RepID=A0AAD9IJ21_PROWI|nr:hypothetical protein QBZ16_003968 [Prototheca wickerhamii]